VGASIAEKKIFMKCEVGPSIPKEYGFHINGEILSFAAVEQKRAQLTVSGVS